jgi:hypothetical protein
MQQQEQGYKHIATEVANRREFTDDPVVVKALRV